MSTAAKPAFKPYVPDEVSMTEFTWSAVLLGAVLGIVFAGSSLYLVLKVGMTVSASIPVAVLSITLFRAFTNAFGMQPKTILENNIVQTTGSAGESIAFGVGVTMPAFLLLGFEMDLMRVMIVSVLGGLLGILAMIPLRRAFIVRMHGRPGEPGTLLYPEGTACAQVLISGDKGGTTGKTVFIGFGIAFAHKFITEGMALLVSTVKVPLGFVNRASSFAGEMASELLGVGYIIGLRTSAIMMAGAVLGYLVIIPTIAFVGDNVTERTIAPGDKLISQMSIKEIRDNYLLFIGAGCVAAAGIISMGRTMPLILRSIQAGLGNMRGGGDNGTGSTLVRRTENDMSMKVVLLGSLALIVVLAAFLLTEVHWVSAVLGAILVVLFGFLFVTVSARLTGEIGSSSNPISGMTVATLMLTCLIFLALGMTSSTDRILALSIAAVVCIASSNGGTTAQALKTGHLLGGTPKLMQYAILFGALTSALIIGGTLLLMNQAGTVYSKKPENVPPLKLNPDELNRLPDTETYDGVTYRVWNTKTEHITRKDANFTPRKEVLDYAEKRAGHFYLVHPQSGMLEIRKDHGIMGKLDEDDDGNKVNRGADAPKTQVMGLIINGVLKRDLNWSMVLIGALIAITLELCGISSLAFAVGVYVPIQYSVPIFLGGIIRYLVDRYQAKSAAAAVAAATTPEEKAMAEIEALRKSETSPGVLIASGYIAGGSLAGVMLAFFAFSKDLPDTLSTWQYRTTTAGQEVTFDQATEALARQELGLPGSPLTEEQQAKVKATAAEIADLNKGMKKDYLRVPKGTVVKLAKGKTHTATADMTLTQLVDELDKAGIKTSAEALENANNFLKEPAHLPAGTKLLVPQKEGPPNQYPVLVPLKPLKVWTREVALQELGLLGKKLEDDERQQKAIDDKVTEITALVDAELLYAIPVAREAKLKLPDNKEYEAKEDTTLGKVAEELFKDRTRAKELKELNTPFKPADKISADASFKLPQQTWPALVGFGLLIAILLATGTEKILRPKPDAEPAAAPPASN